MSNPFRLVRLALQEGMDVHFSGRFAAYVVKSFLLLPFALYEYIFLSRKIGRQDIQHPPLFILGHWRSGTTYLFRLLSHDPQLAFCCNRDLLLPVQGPGRIADAVLRLVVRLAGLRNFAYNNVPLALTDPQEEEIVLTTAHASVPFYWGFVFPRRLKSWFCRSVLLENSGDRRIWQEQYLYTLRRLTARAGGRRLLLKSPANTARVAALLELFPDARCIYIDRDPEKVITSTLRTWTEGIRRYGLQKMNPSLSESDVREMHAATLAAFNRDSHLFREGKMVKVTYEALSENPERELDRIYAALGMAQSAPEVVKAAIEVERKLRIGPVGAQ